MITSELLGKEISIHLSSGHSFEGVLEEIDVSTNVLTLKGKYRVATDFPLYEGIKHHIRKEAIVALSIVPNSQDKKETD